MLQTLTCPKPRAHADQRVLPGQDTLDRGLVWSGLVWSRCGSSASVSLGSAGGRPKLRASWL
jgi:hypothetical protein